MHIDDFSYELPKERIAQSPLSRREEARLMVLDPNQNSIEHRHVYDLIHLLDSQDVLVFNDTKVFPARLHGSIGEKNVEILLHREMESGVWECLVKPGKLFQVGTPILFPGLSGTVEKIHDDGSRIIRFSEQGKAFDEVIDRIGEIPLPPYIKNSTIRSEDYQTIYSRHRGSVAAPTAGLHFTPELLSKLKNRGVKFFFLTLHVGRGTFESIRVEQIRDHQMHQEYFELTDEVAEALNASKSEGKRIVAVGTTTARVLETCAKAGRLQSRSGWTNLFITPGYSFQFVDALMTNFHLPKSTLLMLVSAFAGQEFIRSAYQEALKHKYRFFSFGDAMFIRPS